MLSWQDIVPKFRGALLRHAWVGLLSISALCVEASGLKITGCASETPPFVLMKDHRGVSGFSVDLLVQIGQHLGRPVEVLERPWARCLEEVKRGDIDVAIDAYDDAERRNQFFYSRAYYTLRPQVFYWRPIYPQGLNVRSGAELQKFAGCGVRGYTYEHYDLDATRMDTGAADDRQMLLKLKAGRCDYAVEELEYIIGSRGKVGGWLDESDLASFEPEWARGPKLHYLIGKGAASREKLHQQIDSAMLALEKSGTLRKLRQKYFSNIKN